MRTESTEVQQQKPALPERQCDAPTVSQSIEWYAEGQTRAVEVDGVRITVRVIARKGRRSRIAITAPVGGCVSLPGPYRYRPPMRYAIFKINA